jgi:hypothetical protein
MPGINSNREFIFFTTQGLTSKNSDMAARLREDLGKVEMTGSARTETIKKIDNRRMEKKVEYRFIRLDLSLNGFPFYTVQDSCLLHVVG